MSIINLYTQVVVHEIGHNLGMNHDFDDYGNPRYSRSGRPCKDVGGYMDYIPEPNNWSECSVEDFTAYYQSLAPDFCLKPRKG